MDIAQCPDRHLYQHAEAVAEASARVHGLRARLDYAQRGHTRDILGLQLEAALQRLEDAEVAQSRALRAQERAA